MDDICGKVVLPFFQDTLEHAMDNFHTSATGVTEQAAVNIFFTGGTNELLDKKIYKLAESQKTTRILSASLLSQRL